MQWILTGYSIIYLECRVIELRFIFIRIEVLKWTASLENTSRTFRFRVEEILAAIVFYNEFSI